MLYSYSLYAEGINDKYQSFFWAKWRLPMYRYRLTLQLIEYNHLLLDAAWDRICSRNSKLRLGIFHANQTYICLDPNQNKAEVGTIKLVKALK